MIHKGFSFLLIFVLACLGARAQSGAPAPSSTLYPNLYGRAELPGLQYTGVNYPRNVFSLGLSQETAYDDNVWNNNQLRRGAPVFGFGGRMAFRQERKHLTWALDYRGDFQFFPEAGINRAFDHGLQVDVGYRVSSRFGLRLRDSLHYSNSLFRPRWNEQYMPELGSPTGLNQTVFLPLAVMFENNLRVDALYVKSRRTSIDVFGGVIGRDFHHRTPDGRRLPETKGTNAGVQYLYQATRADTIGALYVANDLRFGDESRAVTHSIFMNYGRRLAPRLDLEVYGGPQYVRLNDRFSLDLGFPGLVLTGRLFRTQWRGALGGSLSWRSEQTALQIFARRTVMDGVSLLSAATNSTLEANMRHRLGRQWHIMWNATFARTNALASRWSGSSFEGQSMGLAFERTLTEHLTAHLGYNLIRQRSDGPVPLQADINRNRVSFGVFYQLSKIPLGR